MAPDDRDRTFEKALARHLRSAAPSIPEAGFPIGASAQTSGELCPDPEMLAAYHDGALSSEEHNLWKQHVLSCDRCQLVLAHLETPLDIAVHLEGRDKVETLQPAMPAARTLPPVSSARPSPLHTLRWLWLVPAGAIAATFVAWVSLQTRKPVELAPSLPVEVAENRQTPAVVPLAKPTPPPSEGRERKESDQALASPATRGAAGAATANRDFVLQDLRKQVPPAQQVPRQYAANPTHGPSFTAQKQEQQILRMPAGVAGTFDQKKKLDAPSDTNAVGGRIVGSLGQAPLAPPPPPPPVSEPGFLADGSASVPPKDKERSAPLPSLNSGAPKAKAVNGDAISATSESVEVSVAPQSPAASRAMLRSAALLNPHVFWAPGGRQAWRIGPAGSLEHSEDKGLSWTLQISGVYTDLVAGSAPSRKVCWIVGTAGTILRTNDGGTHWTKVDSPVTKDLAGIRATDASHAWIWFVSDPQTGLIETYQSNDGGATWSPVSN
jgi:hypothetical protein